MKISKSEWDAFWEVVGKDWYFDDSDVPDAVDEGKMTPDTLFDFTCGVLIWQGRGEPAAIGSLTSAGDSGHDLVALIRKWKKSLTVTTVVVEVPKDKLEELDKYVKSLKGKIVK